MQNNAIKINTKQNKNTKIFILFNKNNINIT